MVLERFWKILGLKNERRVIFTFFILLVISLLEFTGLILVIPYVNIMIDSDKWFGKKYMNKKHKAKSGKDKPKITEDEEQFGDSLEF